MTFSSTEFPINYSPKVVTESKFLVKYKPISSRRNKPAYKFNKRISQSIMKHQKKKRELSIVLTCPDQQTNKSTQQTLKSDV